MIYGLLPHDGPEPKVPHKQTFRECITGYEYTRKVPWGIKNLSVVERRMHYGSRQVRMTDVRIRP